MTDGTQSQKSDWLSQVGIRIARNWWLRSPNPNLTNANNAYNVNTTGVLNNNNANNAYGAVPDCVISVQVGKSIAESSKFTQGEADLAER
jgi:hypothetical protein